MNKFLVFMLFGWMGFTTVIQADHLSGSIKELSDSSAIGEGIESFDSDDVNLRRHTGKSEGKRSKPRTFGYASLPASDMSQFPACNKVLFTQLVLSSDNVSLKNGELVVPRGVYRLAYGVNLQNNGGADLMQTWLTIKSQTTQPIPDSVVQTNILSNPSNSTAFQGHGEVLVKVYDTSRISLNYTTRGTSNLSSVSVFPAPPPPVPPLVPPLPFYLFAIKVGDIKT